MRTTTSRKPEKFDPKRSEESGPPREGVRSPGEEDPAGVLSQPRQEIQVTGADSRREDRGGDPTPTRLNATADLSSDRLTDAASSRRESTLQYCHTLHFVMRCTHGQNNQFKCTVFTGRIA